MSLSIQLLAALAVLTNAVVYGTLTAWEIQHVRHHLNCRIVESESTDGQRAA